MNNLKLKNGIWYSELPLDMSYPEDGNDNYFEIEKNSFWFKHRNNCIINILGNFLPNGTLYDIGGGNGCISHALQKNNFDVTLIEPGVRGCLNAQRRGIKKIVCSTLKNSGFAKDLMDSIGIFDVLEHMEKDSLFLMDIKKYLKQNGRLYITVPAFNFLWSYDDDYAKHFRRYRLKDLIGKLEKAGFNIEYATYFFVFLPIPIFFFRTLLYKFSRKPENIMSNNKKEHNKNNIFLNTILNLELFFIKKRWKINFGSSCLVVAKKL